MTDNTAFASDVRAFFLANPDKTPKDDKSVGPKSAGRGKVSADAVKVFSEATGRVVGVAKGNKVVGESPVTVNYRHAQPSGRTVGKSRDMTRTEIRALGVNVGERGRIPASVLEAAGEALSAESAKDAQARGKAAAKAPKAAKSADQPVKAVEPETEPSEDASAE